jgi:hypothetical protein
LSKCPQRDLWWAVVELHETATLACGLLKVDVNSMDEAVLDLAGISTEALYTYGQMLWTISHPWTGIPVSMSIGSTKTRANPANRLAKLSLEAHAVGALLSSPEVEAILAEPLHEVHHGTPALVYHAQPTERIRVYLVYSPDPPTEGGTKMKLGLLTYAVDVAELAAQAEALGFDSFWVPEHTTTPVHIALMHTTYRLHLEPDGTPQPVYRSGQFVDPFIALTRASAVTTRIKPGTGVCLVPEHHPLLLAKHVATLDNFSGGRCICWYWSRVAPRRE